MAGSLLTHSSKDWIIQKTEFQEAKMRFLEKTEMYAVAE
jgi:hypothetical protein